VDFSYAPNETHDGRSVFESLIQGVHVCIFFDILEVYLSLLRLSFNLIAKFRAVVSLVLSPVFL